MRERRLLRHYADTIAMWQRGFNTADIADYLRIPESLVDRWVHNWHSVETMAAAS